MTVLFADLMICALITALTGAALGVGYRSSYRRPPAERPRSDAAAAAPCSPAPGGKLP